MIRSRATSSVILDSRSLSCCFACRYGRSGKKGRVDLAYKLSPRGCAGRVHPQWIPQLQLHTLATGCQSVLLVSRYVGSGRTGLGGTAHAP